ncbi:MAG: putative amidohydrolase YtcJ [Candidatus Promineifilaceae bacterium]|jgi:predicted amidohydrolase YtcJ
MQADVVIKNGAIYTVDDDNLTAEAIAISGNKIVFVGNEDGLAEFVTEKTRVIDANGKTVMPGFIDAHFHLLWGAKSLSAAQLYDCHDLQSLGERLTEWANAHPESEWVLGNGMSYAVPSADIDLNRHHLDGILADRPMLLYSFDVHTVWLNTAGLEKVGLLHGYSELPGDADVVMGADGLATGALIEPAAYNLAVEKLPEPTESELFDILRNGLKAVAANGITTIHDMTSNMAEMKSYGVLEDQGELTVRVYSNQLIDPEHEVADIERLAVPLRETFQSGLLRAGFLKFFMDGVYESYSAVALNGYPDQPDNHGEPIFSAEKFAALAAEGDRLGFQIAVHACGDGAVRRVLDGYESVIALNGKRDSRHRVEHIELISEQDVSRFVELGVVASMQPLHAPIEPDSGDIWPSRIANAELDRAFAWRTLRDAGAHIAFGSDWPVVTLDPILGLHAAVNRQPMKPGTNSHNQTLAEAIAGYTKDAAWTEFMEEEKGQIKVGMLADIVILSQNLFEIPAEEIINTKPTMTIMDGRIVFEEI